MKWMLPIGTMVASLVASFAATPPTFAQDASKPASAVCMSRAADTPDQHLLVIVLPSDQQDALAAKGFSMHSCDDTPGAFSGYQASICKLAANAPAALLDQFTKDNNISPGKLCDLANSASVH